MEKYTGGDMVTSWTVGLGMGVVLCHVVTRKIVRAASRVSRIMTRGK